MLQDGPKPHAVKEEMLEREDILKREEVEQTVLLTFVVDIKVKDLFSVPLPSSLITNPLNKCA